jgi:hypothetical protein
MRLPARARHLAGALFGIVTKTSLTHVRLRRRRDDGGGNGRRSDDAFNTLETASR